MSNGFREVDSERVAVMVRVLRAASVSGDIRLRDAAVTELKRYGINVAEVSSHSMREGRSDG